MPEATTMNGSGFLSKPSADQAVEDLYASDVQRLGFVLNLSQLWAHGPGLYAGLSALIDSTGRAAALTARQRAVLVTSCASALGDSYCSLVWGRRLARDAGADVAAGVLRGADDGLDSTERALARWARTMTRRPNGTEPADLEPLRAAGYDDRAIFAITAFIALRLAFAYVNDALGARPDTEWLELVPAPVCDAVTFGRPPGNG